MKILFLFLLAVIFYFYQRKLHVSGNRLSAFSLLHLTSHHHVVESRQSDSHGSGHRFSQIQEGHCEGSRDGETPVHHLNSEHLAFRCKCAVKQLRRAADVHVKKRNRN